MAKTTDEPKVDEHLLEQVRWARNVRGVPTATPHIVVNKKGITLNTAARSLLGVKPGEVADVGYDPLARRLIIRAHADGEWKLRRISKTGGGAKVVGKLLVRWMQDNGIPEGRFAVTLSDNPRMLLAQL